MEADKKQRQEEELKNILSAIEETKRLKAEALRNQSAEAEATSKKQPEPVQLAGNKRKSLCEAPNGVLRSSNPAKAPHYQHKRSRTIGSMLPPTAPPPPAAAPISSSSTFRHSIFSGRSSLGRSVSSANLRKSEIRQKQDETQSPYWRFLAAGIDPDTPSVPMTARQIEAKQRREKGEREAAIARAYNRRRVGAAASTQQQSPPPQLSTSTAEISSPAVSASSPQPSITGSAYNPETDELLQQLREARQALADDSIWFKEQSEQMEKEFEAQEKLRSSQNSSSGLQLGASQNGYYRNTSGGSPASASATKTSLSRVEQILERNPRAMALANYKPTKGPDSRPTPMSKRTAQAYAEGQDGEGEIETNGTAKKRRKPAGVLDRTYRPTKDELEEDAADMDLQFSPTKRSKKQHVSPAVGFQEANVEFVGIRPQKLQSASENKFAQVQQREEMDLTDEDDEDDLFEEDEEGVEEEDETGGFGHYFKDPNVVAADQYQQQHLAPGSPEYSYDDGANNDGDANTDDDDEESEVDDGADYDYVVSGKHLPQSLYYNDEDEADFDDEEDSDLDEDEDEDEDDGEQAPTPYTQASTSRAPSSGPGATVDDAIALSDSD